MNAQFFEFISGTVFGMGAGYAMLKHGISLFDPKTRTKAVLISGVAVAAWWLVGELLWR